ncbi:SMI1/KNR4 family protein [Gemmata sp.]|uniref:SMI1/KNR4 family protein n=1 Tax=Gemmata sp. TaxID=1914242 RepID=UPI003F72E845
MTRKEFARALRKQFRRRRGHLNPLPEDAEERLDAVEHRLGFTLPADVRFIFTHAGEDFIAPEESVEQNVRLRDDPQWPERMLVFAEEGCGIWLCIDCNHEAAPVLRWRGDYIKDAADPPIFEHVSPSFLDWLAGEWELDGDVS